MATEGIVNEPVAGGNPTNEPNPNPAVAKPTDNQPSNSGNPNPVTKPGADDRATRGMLADLQKERTARQALEAQIAERDRKIAALAGVQTHSPQEQSDEEIRKEFQRLYPELTGLTKEDIEALRELRNQQAAMQETTDHYWTSHADAMLDSLITEVSTALKGDLSERQIKKLVAAYTQEARVNPEFLDRHNRGDKKLIKEFATEWLEDWYEPGKRAALASEVNRNRLVPRGDRSITPPGAAKPIDVTDNKQVEDVLVDGFRRNGGVFGRNRRQ